MRMCACVWVRVGACGCVWMLVGAYVFVRVCVYVCVARLRVLCAYVYV
jgi:hypothetical protein